MSRETKFYQLLFAWILALAFASTSYGLRISAFNVQKFGDKKRNNAKVMDIIVKIINRYDVILIQEVMDGNRDSNETIAALKRRGLRGFTHVSSDALGKYQRTREHYLFLIRENVGLTVANRLQFKSSKVKFERPPFSIKLRSTRSGTKGLKEFVLSAIHVKPGEKVTKKEIRQLKDVHGELKAKLKTNNIIIMGDMNAGGRYIKPEELAELPIANPPFLWLPKDTNTALSCYLYDDDDDDDDDDENTEQAKNCPYDRFIITGAALKKYLDPNKTGIFPFDKEYKLTEGKAKAVSDHYPIELQLRG